MQTFPMALSEDEARLIEAVQAVRFGEVYGVKIEPGPVGRLRRLSSAERALVLEMRDGLREISVLHVHEGQPVYAEVDEKVGGFRCRKKVRFGQ